MSRTEFMNVLGLADRRYFAMTYLRPGVEGGFGRDDAPGQSEKQGAKIPRLTILGEQVRDSWAELMAIPHASVLDER